MLKVVLWRGHFFNLFDMTKEMESQESYLAKVVTHTTDGKFQSLEGHCLVFNLKIYQNTKHHIKGTYRFNLLFYLMKHTPFHNLWLVTGYYNPRLTNGWGVTTPLKGFFLTL